MGDSKLHMLKCALCGGSLPEGTRRDRRYCREACRTMAYRQRRTQDATIRTPSSQPVVAQDLSQQLAQLTRELEGVKQRLASLESSLGPRSQTQHAQEHGAHAATSQPEIREEPPQFSEPATESTGSTTAMSPPMSTETEAPSPSAPAPVSHPAPWMMQRPEEPTQKVPRWTLWTADFLQSVDSHAERVLDGMPATIAAQGHLAYGTQIRRWIAADRSLLIHIARQMTRRLIATPLSERQPNEQQLRLADWIVLDLAPELPAAGTTERQQLAQYLANHMDNLKLLSLCIMATVGTQEGPQEK